MIRYLIDFICCKLERGKALKKSKIDDENLTNDILESTVITEKEIEDEMLNQVKQMENEFNCFISNIINNCISKIIYKLMKENLKITEEQVLNTLSWFVIRAYKDMLNEINDGIIKNNKDLIVNISNMIKDSMHINKNENSDLANKEINKSIDRSMPLYNEKIIELIDNQVKSLKIEIDKSIGGQLLLTNKEFEINNINIVVLEKRLKNFTNDIMNDFVVQNKKEFNTILGNISEDFKKLKEDIADERINKEVEKTVDDFKEIYDNSAQKSIDGTLEIAKVLNKFNVSNYEIIKNKEISKKLQEAFNVAETEIDIISPWINNQLLYKTDVYSFIKDVIRKGIRVKILYGIGENEKSNTGSLNFRRKNSEKIEKRLKKDFHEYGHAFEIKKGDTNSKILICDNKFAIIGSHNLLSLGGEYENDIRDEIAAVTTDPITISGLRTHAFNF